MKKRWTALLLATAICFLGGCGSIFEKEYVVVSDYAPPAQDSIDRGDRITVRNLNELKTALLGLVSAGESEGAILFDTDYDGDVSADLASACWQVRTQDALCAYCVDNIAYDLSKIVARYEAGITITYSEAALESDSILKMQYSTGIEDRIRAALEDGRSRLVVLIVRSFYSAEEMESLVNRVYRTYPASAPEAPRVSVNMFSGAGRQRLYEIHLGYSLSGEDLESRREELAQLDPFAEADTSGQDDGFKALLACEYLAENCTYTTESQRNDIYAALVEQSANSEGMALAYVELCRRLAVPCQIVYGQLNRENHCWNIVEIDGAYYHVDTAVCAEGGMESGFLMRDQEAWAEYRWDMAAYPVCAGELRYQDLAVPSDMAEENENDS